METAHLNGSGEEGWRGTDGPLHVTRGTHDQPALPRLHRGRACEAGYSLHRRLQRLEAGGLWADGDDGVEGPPLVGRERLSPPGAEAPERARSGPARAPSGSSSTAAARSASSIRRWGRHRDGARAQGGHRRRLGDQLAEASDAVRASARRSSCASTASRSSPTARASAPTCRTISRSMCSRPARGRSR